MNHRAGIWLRDKRYHKRQKRRLNHRENLARYKIRSEYFERNVLNRQIYYLPLPAPKIFSLLQNRDETIAFISRVTHMLENGTYTQMDFSHTLVSDLPTICVLGAFMMDSRTPARYLRVTIPGRDKKERKIWDQVQFENMILRGKTQDFDSGGFLSRTSKTINKAVITDVLNGTLKYFGEERRDALQDLNGILSELVENTTLHAVPGKTSHIPYIINTRDITLPDKKAREYCIVDLGVGVYDNVRENVAKWNTRRHKLLHRLSEIFDEGQTQNNFLSKYIPRGIGSSTNKVTRGKGIRHAYEIAQSPIYTTFDIITNKAHVHFKQIGTVNDDTEHSFSGTVYYWKIAFDE